MCDFVGNVGDIVIYTGELGYTDSNTITLMKAYLKPGEKYRIYEKEYFQGVLLALQI